MNWIDYFWSSRDWNYSDDSSIIVDSSSMHFIKQTLIITTDSVSLNVVTSSSHSNINSNSNWNYYSDYYFQK